MDFSPCFRCRVLAALVLVLTVTFIVSTSRTRASARTPADRGHVSTRSDSPDVVLISVDTLRWDSVFGDQPEGQLVQSFRDNAIALRQVISSSSWTLPSHASLFTGQLPYRHRAILRGSVNSTLDTSLTTVAERFQQLGYSTGGFTDGGYLSRSWGFHDGFDRYRVTEKTRDHLFKYSIQNAQSWIQDKNVPLFTFVHTYQVHDYWKIRSYCRSSIDASRQRRLRNHDSDGSAPEQLNVLPRTSPLRLKVGKTLYDCEVRHSMRRLNRFFNWLKERQRYRSSLIIVFSDHGEGFSLDSEVIGHGRGQLNERLTRVPVLVKYPKGDTPPKLPASVSVRHLFPRLLEPYYDFDLNGSSRHASGTKSMSGRSNLVGSGYRVTESTTTDRRRISPVFFTRTRRYRMEYSPGESERRYFRIYPGRFKQISVPARSVPDSVKHRLKAGFMDYVERSKQIYREQFDRERLEKKINRRQRRKRRNALDGLGYLD